MYSHGVLKDMLYYFFEFSDIGMNNHINQSQSYQLSTFYVDLAKLLWSKDMDKELEVGSCEYSVCGSGNRTC